MDFAVEDSIEEIEQEPSKEATVWVVNERTTFICNTSEEAAVRLVETHPTHIYFFAELVAPQAD